MPPAPKIGKQRIADFTYYFFPIHSSLTVLEKSALPHSLIDLLDLPNSSRIGIPEGKGHFFAASFLGYKDHRGIESHWPFRFLAPSRVLAAGSREVIP